MSPKGLIINNELFTMRDLFIMKLIVPQVYASKTSKKIVRKRKSTVFVMKGGVFVVGTSSAGGCTAARTCARSEGSSIALRSAGSAVPPQQWHPPHLLVQAPPGKIAVGAGLVMV